MCTVLLLTKIVVECMFLWGGQQRKEVSRIFDPEVDLNDDAIRRSRYELRVLFSLQPNNATETLRLRVHSRNV